MHAVELVRGVFFVKKCMCDKFFLNADKNKLGDAFAGDVFQKRGL